MFASQRSIAKRTGQDDLSRAEYLKALVNEFQQTTDESAREQILANLANFAYDPINYGALLDLNVPDLFVDCLTENNLVLVEHGAGGIANLSCDDNARQMLLAVGAVKALLSQLSCSRVGVVQNVLLALYFLATPANLKEIVCPDLITRCHALKSSASGTLKNLAVLMLEDVVGVPVRQLDAYGR